MTATLADEYTTIFLIDSGSDVNLVAEQDWEALHELYTTGSCCLYDYNTGPRQRITAYAAKKPLTVVASFSAWLESGIPGKPRRFARWHVVKGGVRSIIGRSTALRMALLRLGAQVNSVATSPDMAAQRPATPFPKIPGEQVQFEIDPSVRPTQNAYYSIPAAYSEAAKARIREMEQSQIIEKVTKAPRWISGMSCVPKGKSDFRLIVNMKGPNRAIMRTYHRMPRLEEIQRKVHGATVFTLLDISSAFHHVELAEESRELTTFMAEDGMYRFTRLVFGVNCAPEKFQQIMERILAGIQGVVIFIDDVLVYAGDLERLRERTEQVLAALNENNLTINTDKCKYERERLTFIGHELSAAGLNIDETKTRAVHAFGPPRCARDLRSFLGLATYVSTFIPKFADLTNKLWKAATAKPFAWGEEEEEAFKATKDAIARCTVTRGFFSDTDDTVLYTDASPVALGAVLVQVSDDGTERIISFASKTLTPTEQRYEQMRREALGIVWAVEHFHYHLSGRHFTIRTDALGMKFIFKQERTVAKRMMNAAQGYALRLGGYDYDIEYVPGAFNIADPSSRLYKGDDPEYTEREGPWEIGALNGTVADLASPAEILTTDEIREATSTDGHLQMVVRALRTNSWPVEVRNYKSMKDELYEHDGLLMKAGTIVIPEGQREQALRVAHSGHPGSTAMRSILRDRVWWPKMDSDAQRWVDECNTCTLMAARDPPVPMARSVLPAAPWDVLALDYNGPYACYGGILILLLVDTFSRYLIAFGVKSTEFGALEACLEQTFGRYGYPTAIKADNGSPFNGARYSDYCTGHGIRELHSTPLFPQQNGMVERYMKVVNKAMESAALDKVPYEEALGKAIRAHNEARHRVTMVAPSELMFKRKLRLGFPVIGSTDSDYDLDAVRQRDEEQKTKAKEHEDAKRGARNHDLEVGDAVAVMRTTRTKGTSRFDPSPWTVISIRRGDLELRASDGRVTFRNSTMVKRLHIDDGRTNGDREGTPEQDPDPAPPTTSGTVGTAAPDPNEPKRSGRLRKPPAHLDMYVRMLMGEPWM